MNYFDHIDDYLQNRLDESTRTAFEHALENDASLKEELDFLKSMRDGFSEEETYALKSRIQKEIKPSTQNSESEKPSSPKKSLNKIWWLLIPLFGILGYFVGKSFKAKPMAPKAIYAQYHQPKPRLGGVRNTQEQKTLDVVLNEMFRGGEYKEVYDRITDLPPNEVNHDYLFTLGLACIELDRNKEAIEIFNQFIDNNNVVYKDQALWSKAMVYLKTEDVKSAKSILGSIAKGGKKDSAKAKEVLQALR